MHILLLVELVLIFRILQHAVLFLARFLLIGGSIETVFTLLVRLLLDLSIAATLLAVFFFGFLVLVLDILVLVDVILILHVTLTLFVGGVLQVRLLGWTLLRALLLRILL
jgi:hypothetical protein